MFLKAKLITLDGHAYLAGWLETKELLGGTQLDTVSGLRKVSLYRPIKGPLSPETVGVDLFVRAWVYVIDVVPLLVP